MDVRVGLQRKLSTKELMLLNCGVGEDSRVLWTARRSNQSILKEISPEYSLEGLMLKLRLQYFGHLMQRTDSLEKTLMLGKIEGKRGRGNVHCCCCSVAKLCPTLCNPMDCSTPGFPVHHQLPELTQTHVHWVSDAIQPSHSPLSPFAFNLSQHQGLF